MLFSVGVLATHQTDKLPAAERHDLCLLSVLLGANLELLLQAPGPHREEKTQGGWDILILNPDSLAVMWRKVQ